MSDPTRLVDEAGDGVTAVERELLRAGKLERLPARDKNQIWLGLAAQVAPPVAPPGSGHVGPAATAAKAAGAKALGGGAALKAVVVAVALGGGSVAGYRALHDAPAPRAAATVAPASPTLSPPVAPVIAPSVPPEERAPLRRSALAPQEPGAARRPPPSRLAAEGRVVLEARAELRDGRAADALRRLEAARAEFAGGALVQEREALTIEALARAGQRAEARRRAAAFLRTYPESPHAAAVQAFASP